jgi:hypothetical protein
MLSLPIQCDCEHGFSIDPAGVDTETDVICPACGQVHHLSQETIDQVEADYLDAIGELEEASYQRLAAALLDAPHVTTAAVIDDGF